MATKLFSDLMQQAKSAGFQNLKAAQARDWFRNQAKRVRTSASLLLGEEGAILTSTPKTGHMYLFQYDPKLKATLPFYDRFPLVVMFKGVGAGFYGLNLHYLPPAYRVQLLDALLSTVSNDKFNKTTQFNVAYSLMAGASKFKAFKPCVKHYLLSHVDSQFLYIHPTQWDTAVFLPLAKFQKKGQATAWADAVAKI